LPKTYEQLKKEALEISVKAENDKRIFSRYYNQEKHQNSSELSMSLCITSILLILICTLILIFG